MSNIRNILEKYNYKPKKIGLEKSINIIETQDDKFIIKKKSNNNTKDIFKYLRTKGFYNYLDSLNSDRNDEYLIFPYIDSINNDISDKAKDLISLTALLHSKTYYYKSISLDEVKKIYEEKTDYLNELDKYYDELRAKMEEKQLMPPSNYYLLRNISWIFHSISSSKYFLDKWYDLIKNKKSIRIVLIHGNLELDHLLESNDKYITSWDNARNDSLVYDLINLYRKNFSEADFYNLFRLYEKFFPLEQYERYFLFSLMFEPTKIVLDNIDILNLNKCYYLIEYLKTSSDIVSNYHSENTNDKDNKKEK